LSGLSPYRLASLVAASAKTVPRTVFFRFAPSLFDSPLLFSSKNKQHPRGVLFIFWWRRGEFVRAIALSPRFARCRVGQNSPPDCFLPLRSLLVRFPSSFLRKKQTTPARGVVHFLVEARGIEPLSENLFL